MVQAGPALRKEPPHGCLRAEGADQLDVRIAHREHHLLDALGLHDFSVDRLHPERVAIELDRGVEIRDRDPDMIDPGQHGRLTASAGPAAGAG